MHEFAATESILAIALEAGKEHGAAQIQTIWIELGRYSGLLPEYVEKYFAVASAGTIAERAELRFESEPVEILCRSCGAKNVLGDGAEPVCPGCGSADFRMLRGWGMQVKRIEIDGAEAGDGESHE